MLHECGSRGEILGLLLLGDEYKVDELFFCFVEGFGTVLVGSIPVVKASKNSKTHTIFSPFLYGV